MKNLKKTMLSFGTMTAIAVPISAVLACNDDDKDKKLSVTDKARIALFDAITKTGGKYVAGIAASPFVPAVKDTFLGVELNTMGSQEPILAINKAPLLKMPEVIAKITGLAAATPTTTKMMLDNNGTSFTVSVPNVTFKTDFATTFNTDVKLSKLYDAIAAAVTDHYKIGHYQLAKGATVSEVKPTLASVSLITIDGGKLAKDFTNEEKIAAIKTIESRIAVTATNNVKTKTDFIVDGTVFTVNNVTLNKDVKTTLGF